MPAVLESDTPTSTAVTVGKAAQPVYCERSFWIAAAVYAVSTGVIFAAAWHLCGGQLVYPLDDVYINMAVARSFATHGVWGVTPFEFNSTTSSPLYVLLLAGVYRLFGVNRYAPAVMSWGFGLVAIYAGTGLLRRYAAPLLQTAGMVAIVLLTPMFLLGTLGMEHALHVLAVFLFLAVFQEEERPHWVAGLATILLCAARYEGLLMAAAGVGALTFERRWRRAAVVAVAAWIPVGCYAWFSIAHGGEWLPNSVLLKGVDGAGTGLGGKLEAVWYATWNNAEKAPHTALMSVGLLLLAPLVWRRRRELGGMLAVVGAAGVLHLMTAAVGWTFRYEAYLVAAGLLVLVCAWPELRRMKGAVAGSAISLFAVAAVLLLFRAATCAAMLPQCSRAIHEQQGQMARFLKTYYGDGSVAANDIGYISYESDAHVLDLAGLASAEVFHAKRAGQDTTEFLEKVAREHQVQVVVVYAGWFADESRYKFGGPKLPAEWERVEQWSVPEQMQLGDKTVSFFGTDRTNAALLRERLDEFDPGLPRRVSVSK